MKNIQEKLCENIYDNIISKVDEVGDFSPAKIWSDTRMCIFENIGENISITMNQAVRNEFSKNK